MNALDSKYLESHRLCFFIHDVIVEFLKSGEEKNIFTSVFDLDDEEKKDLGNFEGHILDWLKNKKRNNEYEIAIKKTLIPAVLSDMLHCIYEVLKAMETGKTTVAYLLLRKPIQENLYLFEEMLLLKSDFIKIFESDPLRLRPKNAGGVEGHQKKIYEILGDLNSILDANYIASLRYDKTNEDSFAGCCNQAMHLFTEHKAIKTENMNVNFIFAGVEAKKTLYDFMYSRLPYLMYYFYVVFEKVVSSISCTTETYLVDIHNRIAAMFLLTSMHITEDYQTKQYYDLCIALEKFLIANFNCSLNLDLLESIASSGKIN
ncbi:MULTISPECIES: hypothetical protein [unclassified Acinetobacter]|uniref:hypothetical protein n=1 Tax=unclassified Acinetobacter TaxID=196816 RepID=UPI0015D2FA37|nr:MULTISPECIES: hypothetical protein [unclassified Acinetobacter]UUS60769.1 hypothetical protein MST17_15855 [Acinetobacter sp. YH16056_T]